MGTDGAKGNEALGFFTVVEHEQQGLFGGYLILNTAGRPLEFHCTAPIKPNRAQQILYGPTLEPYLYGEQIGQALISKGSLQPLVVCTDRPAALAVREHINVPTALVSEEKIERESSAASSSFRLDGPHRQAINPPFTIGRNMVRVAAAYPDDRAEIERRLQSIREPFDLAEPFQRIREAIEEARSAGK